MTDEEMQHAARAGIPALLALFRIFDADEVLSGSPHAPALFLATLMMMQDSVMRTSSEGFDAPDLATLRAAVTAHQSAVSAYNSRVEGSS